MALAAKGNEKAFVILYDRHSGIMLRFFSRLLHPDTEKTKDLLQELFIKLFSVPEKYNREMEFRPWLYKVAGNMAMNELRNTRNRRRLADEAALDIEIMEYMTITPNP